MRLIVISRGPGDRTLPMPHDPFDLARTVSCPGCSARCAGTACRGHPPAHVLTRAVHRRTEVMRAPPRAIACPGSPSHSSPLARGQTRRPGRGIAHVWKTCTPPVERARQATIYTPPLGDSCALQSLDGRRTTRPRPHRDRRRRCSPTSVGYRETTSASGQPTEQVAAVWRD